MDMYMAPAIDAMMKKIDDRLLKHRERLEALELPQMRPTIAIEMDSRIAALYNRLDKLEQQTSLDDKITEWGPPITIVDNINIEFNKLNKRVHEANKRINALEESDVKSDISISESLNRISRLEEWINNHLEKKVRNAFNSDSRPEQYDPAKPHDEQMVKFKKFRECEEKKEEHPFALKYDGQKLKDIYKEFAASPFDDLDEFEKHRKEKEEPCVSLTEEQCRNLLIRLCPSCILPEDIREYMLFMSVELDVIDGLNRNDIERERLEKEEK